MNPGDMVLLSDGETKALIVDIQLNEWNLKSYLVLWGGQLQRVLEVQIRRVISQI